METSTGASVGSGLVVLAAKASGTSKACPLPKARPSCAAVGLGHSRVDVALEIYNRVMEEDMDEALVSLRELLDNPLDNLEKEENGVS
jgi:hypothetical protein